MAKTIRQYRYYGAGDSHNQPSGITHNNLFWGTIFNSDGPIIQLGIQSLPGTKFYLNGSEDPIIIGSTGIYELNVENYATITALQFADDSITNIEEVNDAYLIVDCIYEEDE